MNLCILQARMSSSRLPGKVLKQINNKPILKYEVDRVLKSKKIDKLVIATSINKEDDEIEKFANSIGVDCYRGDLNNVLKRYYECALKYNADTIIRITGDCPVIAPDVIDNIMDLFEKSKVDYISNTLERTFPDGLDVEVFSFTTLKKIYFKATDKDDLEHVTRYIYTHSDEFKIEQYKNDIDYSYMRWTLDTIDDFYFFKSIYKNNDNVFFHWKYLLSKTNSAEKFLIDSNQTIRHAMKKLEEIVDTGIEALYVIEHNKLIGTISTGDIRRALIYFDITNNDQIIKVANKNFKYLIENKSYDKTELRKDLKFKFLPLLKEDKTFIRFVEIKNLIKRNNKIILMAGGLGSRLKELTKNIPKPMLKVGNKPILEIIINQFKKYDFYDFYISVNYKAEIIENYFENGNRFGVNIKYIKEKEKLGTAGCLSLIKEELDEPLILMNGDILTDINFSNMLNFHKTNKFELTIGVAIYNTYIPYGVLNTKNNQLISIEEKPTKNFFISGGVYILNHTLLKEIPNNYYDMPMLIEKLLKENRKIGVYQIENEWIDIGHIEDFYNAQIKYQGEFND
jgi:spore coat polysaccharide biosynthesis protein SpsF (cytidylyltransferase family)